jgi:hypothetical protein
MFMFTFPCTLYTLASETTGDVFAEAEVPEIPMGIDCGDSDSLEFELGD